MSSAGVHSTSPLPSTDPDTIDANEQPRRAAGRRADIQALRALAVAAVVAFHVAPAAAPGGFIGVDVFFVVSGYLVGGHLYREALAGHIDFRQFFAKRARRIMPVSALVATLTIVWAALIASPLDLMLWGPHATTPTYTRDGIASVLGVANLWFGVSDQGYLMDAYQSPFTQYWSLGVEEQFYVAAPVLLALVLWRSRNTKLAVLVVAAVTVLSFDMAIYGAWLGGVSPFFNPWTRAWELGVGLLVAMLGHRVPRRLSGGLAGSLVIACGWLTLLVLVATVRDSTVWPSPLTAVPVLATAGLLGIGASRQPGRLARWSPLQWLGDRSYSIYLWHWPLVIFILGLDSDFTLLSIAVVALTIAFSWASYRWVESPLRRLAVSTPATAKRALLICGAIAAGAITVLVAVGANASTGTASSQLHAAPYRPVPVGTGGQQFATVVPLNLRPSLVDAGQDNPVSYSDGCNVTARGDNTEPGNCVYGNSGPLIALFGDSHALQWLGALEPGIEQGRYRVAIVTADACAVYGGLGPEIQKPGCAEWQPAALAHIKSLAPELVIISAATWPQHDFATTELASTADHMDDLARQLDGLAVAWVADTPFHGFVPTNCALEDVNDVSSCSTTRSVALGSPLTALFVATAQANDWAWIDLNEYLCDQTQCGIILGDAFMYRDDDHITNTLARELAPVVEAKILAALSDQSEVR